MPLPKPKLLAGWRRAKLIALINESYLSFRVAAPVGLWSTRLRCPQIRRLDLFVTRWPSTCDAQRNQNSEPKLRPPAVSKSLTRSNPYLILEDADLDLAATVGTRGRLVNSGQSCIAAKRFIIVEKV